MEVDFSPPASSRTLRGKKRYAVPLCPLLEVTWWRAIFDEAQKARRCALHSRVNARNDRARHLQLAHAVCNVLHDTLAHVLRSRHAVHAHMQVLRASCELNR